MKKWKIWLIVSSVLSIICGLVATIMFLDMLFGHCFIYPVECLIYPDAMEAWWSIPLAFFVGFIIPTIAYVYDKIHHATKGIVP